ncbi:hypothetical protein V8C35DRAFT_230554 [Trichoderma chlorosporum]
MVWLGVLRSRVSDLMRCIVVLCSEKFFTGTLLVLRLTTLSVAHKRRWSGRSNIPTSYIVGPGRVAILAAQMRGHDSRQVLIVEQCQMELAGLWGVTEEHRFCHCLAREPGIDQQSTVARDSPKSHGPSWMHELGDTKTCGDGSAGQVSEIAWASSALFPPLLSSAEASPGHLNGRVFTKAVLGRTRPRRNRSTAALMMMIL